MKVTDVEEASRRYLWRLKRKPEQHAHQRLCARMARRRAGPPVMGVAAPLPACSLFRVEQVLAVCTPRRVLLVDTRRSLGGLPWPPKVRVGKMAQPFNGPQDAALEASADAVLVDTLQTPWGMHAGLDRAAWACRVGGVVSVLVHPGARVEANAAVKRLPLDVISRSREHTAWMLPCGVELAARWDHWLLRRVDNGHAVLPGTDAHVLEHAHVPVPVHDMHAFDDVLPATGHALAWEDVVAEVEGALGDFDVQHQVLARDGEARRAAWAIQGGGHVAVVQDPADGRVAVDLFPFHAELMEWTLERLFHVVKDVTPSAAAKPPRASRPPPRVARRRRGRPRAGGPAR